MQVADAIRRRGFRRWYERQLVESHVYLVTAILALILLMAGVESFDLLRGSPMYYVLALVIAAAAGMLTFVAWRRFVTLLGRAEQFAATAGCPGCKTWGRFDVLAEERAEPDDPVEAGRPHWLRVRCRKCSETWRVG
jgi:hypothetical protein